MPLLPLTLLLSLSLSGAVIYKREGGGVIIPTDSGPERITFITWKHNRDLALEWDGGEPLAYRNFNGCTTVDTFTGALNISNLTRGHSGNYTAEINNKVIGTTEVQVISPVPKPTVSMWCDAERTYCTLTCEGNTTDTGPVTYAWHTFDAYNYSKVQQINITEDNSEPWFRCEMTNPISSEESEEFLNPLLSRNRMFTIILVSCIMLFLIVLICVICVAVKRKSKKENKELGGSCNGVVMTTSKYKQTVTFVAETSNQAVMDSEDPKSCRNGLNTPAATESEIPPDEVLVQMCVENPVSSATTENSLKRDEQIEVQVHRPETPESNHPTENSLKREEQIEVQVHRPETPESNHPTVMTTSKHKETVTSVAETSNQAATDSEDPKSCRNGLNTPAATESEDSAEELNQDDTARPLLESQNYSISVSA